MTAVVEKFLITNESEFEAFIAKMMGRKDLDSDEFCFPDLEFKGWPTISINVKGDKKKIQLIVNGLHAIWDGRTNQRDPKSIYCHQA